MKITDKGIPGLVCRCARLLRLCLPVSRKLPRMCSTRELGICLLCLMKCCIALQGGSREHFLHARCMLTSCNLRVITLYGPHIKGKITS
jgi:hypothetical protein